MIHLALDLLRCINKWSPAGAYLKAPGESRRHLYHFKRFLVEWINVFNVATYFWNCEQWRDLPNPKLALNIVPDGSTEHGSVHTQVSGHCVVLHWWGRSSGVGLHVGGDTVPAGFFSDTIFSDSLKTRHCVRMNCFISKDSPGCWMGRGSSAISWDQ